MYYYHFKQKYLCNQALVCVFKISPMGLFIKHFRTYGWGDFIICNVILLGVLQKMCHSGDEGGRGSKQILLCAPHFMNGLF